MRIYPTPEQQSALDRQFGSVRFVWNRALAIMRHRYRVHGQSLSAKHDLKKLLPVAKRNRRYAWLAEADSMALQQSLLNLDRAFKAFFEGRARYPSFKGRRGRQSSYHLTGRTAVVAGAIEIPKVPGAIEARLHREVTGLLKSITLSRSVTGKYYAALLYDDGARAPEPAAVVMPEAIVGVDVGLTHLMIESTGRKTENPRHLRRAAKNLRRKQKSLSRKKKGSKNRAKARLRVAKAHERVANARADFQHKQSRRLVDENQAIVVESLAIKNLLKNHCLARAISDAAWGLLVTKLKYKAKAAGVHLVELNRFAPTSKTCSLCDHKLDDLPLAVRTWTCPKCGSEHDRDLNAAANLKRWGILELRTGGWHVPACGGLRKSTPAVVAASETGNSAAQAA